MINTSMDQIVFNANGPQLNLLVRNALETSADWIVKSFGLEEKDLSRVTTKTNPRGIFPALAKHCTLSNPDVTFDEKYVLRCFDAYTSVYPGMSEEDYLAITLVTPNSKLRYTATSGYFTRRGLGALLLAMHANGAITLPYSFSWPLTRVKRKWVELCDPDSLPPLLSVVRNLAIRADTKGDAALGGLLPRQRERLAWQVTKLLVMTGWKEPADANYKDLLLLSGIHKERPFVKAADLGVAFLVDVLERRYGAEINLSSAGWRAALSDRQIAIALGKSKEASDISDGAGELELTTIFEMSPMSMCPDRLTDSVSLPGLRIDLSPLSKSWADLERLFIRKIRRENEKQVQVALGYLNIYLFAYLPWWMRAHPESELEFPSAPNKLTAGIFVSDLGLVPDIERPLALVEFLENLVERKEWSSSTHYATLKQIEKFFLFLERHKNELPGCNEFRQPLSPSDYPPSARSRGTNKRPIPRRIFAFYLLYVEALLAHTNALMSRIIAGDLDAESIHGLGHRSNVIDTFKAEEQFGFVPVVFYRGKTIPLRRIPNTLNFQRHQLKDGRVIRIPEPHSLHHILVALHTGIRNNHIQWLDAETFDKFDDGLGQEFTKLYVNTDKVKNTGWTPHVHRRVMEILRSQLEWRNLVADKGFREKVYYNNNSKSKWGKFFPLFSALLDGRPHHDGRYASVWLQLLAGVQSQLLYIGESSLQLCRLLPRGVPYNDLNIEYKLEEFGASQRSSCELTIKSDISPHSARVSVVSHSITVLPADVIGLYITGQTPKTVCHYVVLDDEEIYREQQLQKLALKQKGYDEGYEAMTSGNTSDSRFIKPDEVNSRLAKSMRENLDEAISAFGFSCLSLNESIATGLDILRETRGQGAVINKTEICPFGNNCPQDLSKYFGGGRRCGLCHYAVRSIDHLPAVTAKGRQTMEMFSEISRKLDSEDIAVTHTLDEIDALEAERGRLAEDLTAWQLVEDVLEVTRQRIASGASNKKWVVQKPEIIEQHLKRAQFPSRETEYLLARMQESVAYPMLESPQIRARSDILRRQLLANTGRIHEAFNPQIPENPAAECLGLIRSVVAANKLTYKDLLEMLDTDKHVDAIPHQAPKLLVVEET